MHKFAYLKRNSNTHSTLIYYFERKKLCIYENVKPNNQCGLRSIAKGRNVDDYENV